MLRTLYIKNYAIIEEIQLDFSSGFNVITGETGAGKSILLGALSLILGKRADTQVLRNSTEKCIIEATFTITQYTLSEFFKEKDIDYFDDCVIRREITSNGKSRAFINDTPVTLDVLQELTTFLVDIHAQTATQQLLAEFFFCEVLDKQAQQENKTANYYQQFIKYKQQQQQLVKLKNEQLLLQKEQDYATYIFNEFEGVNLEEEHFLQLEQQTTLQQHAEQITQNLQEASHLLNGSDYSINQQLIQLNKLIQGIKNYGTIFIELHEAIVAIQEQCYSIQRQLQQNEATVEYNPNQLEQLQEELNSINRLLQKHHVTTIKELQEIKQSYQHKLAQFSSNEEEIHQLEKSIIKAEEELLVIAQQLSKQRQKIAITVAKSLEHTAQLLGMAHARIELAIAPTSLNAKGIDDVVLLFSPNKGIAPQPLHLVGSGGEKSRLMLAIKSLTAQTTNLPTLIFDEIDTGISGEVALKVADLLKYIAQQHQIIAITHLPQVAAKAQHHFFVYKNHDTAVTYTTLKKLNPNERIQEIAIMLSGANPNTAAIENAKILMNS